MNDDDLTNNPNASFLNEDEEPELNLDTYRQDHGGLITTHNGMADALLRNNKLYNSMKGDWSRTSWNASQNIKVTTGREDNKFFIKREQMNAEAIRDRCKRYRQAAEQGVPDPMAPIGEDGKLTWKFMDLPKVIAIRISDEYFGGIPWQVIKHDRTMKAQFYQIVERDYNDYVCYPGGKLPLPIRPRIPSKRGGDRTLFFRGDEK